VRDRIVDLEARIARKKRLVNDNRQTIANIARVLAKGHRGRDGGTTATRGPSCGPVRQERAPVAPITSRTAIAQTLEQQEPVPAVPTTSRAVHTFTFDGTMCGVDIDSICFRFDAR